MSYKIQQHRISRGGFSYHFVSYAGQPANVRKGEEATGPMWYLMRAGKRWPVMPQDPGQTDAETMRALATWLEAQHLPDKQTA
jgi:hypothetical protein